jgi:hypothetical protein
MSAEILCGRLRALLEICAPTKFNDVVFALQDAQEEIRAKFGLTKLAIPFAQTELLFHVQQFPDGKIEVHREHPTGHGMRYLEQSKKGFTLRLKAKNWPWERRKRSKRPKSKARKASR